MLSRLKKIIVNISPIIFILGTLIGLHAAFLFYFHYIKNIIGFDAPAHLAAIQVISQHIAPSMWGWTQQWYAGMPLPLFYPPIPYYISSIFISSHTAASVLTYKYISEISIIINVLVAFAIVRNIFTDHIEQYKKYIISLNLKEYAFLQQIRIYAPIALAIIVVFFLNTGAPGVLSLSHGLFSHLFAMVWFFISVFCFWKQTKKSLIYASITTPLLLLSNVHAFLTLCLLLPFLILYRTYQKPYLKNTVQHILRSTSYFSIGILISSCWFLPMLFYYSYFAGIYKIDIYLNNRFLLQSFPVLLMLIPAIIIAIRQKSKLIHLYLAITSTYLILFGVDILQRSSIDTVALPIQLWRWYETVFVLLIIPVAHVLFVLMRKYRHAGVLLLLILFMYSVTQILPYDNTYTTYFSEDVPGLKSHMQKNMNNDLTFVHGRGHAHTTYRQTAIDAELGSAGHHTIFSNLRESSINSLFLRQAKHMVSIHEEDWALINYIQSTNQNVFIDSRYDLLHFLGVNKIIIGDSDRDTKPGAIYFASTTRYTKSKPSHAFTLLESKTPQARATQIRTPLTLIFAEHGFRDRKISDLTYTRFQEISFEKKLYTRSIAFSPHTLVIEDSAEEINKAKYIVLATLETRDIDKALDVVENALRHPNRKVFIHASKKYKNEYRAFATRFADHEQVNFVDIKNNIFPFDEVISDIIKSEPFEYREDALFVGMSNTNVHISNPYALHGQRVYAPPESKNLVQTIWFIRQSYFPAWIATAQDGTILPTYLASPGYTLVFPNKNTAVSLYFSTPTIVIIGHILSLIGLTSLLGITIYQYRRYHTISQKKKN